jgi:hypothetical protein
LPVFLCPHIAKRINAAHNFGYCLEKAIECIKTGGAKMDILAIIIPNMTDKEKQIFRSIHAAFADAGYTYDMAIAFLQNDIVNGFTALALKHKMAIDSQPPCPSVRSGSL